MDIESIEFKAIYLAAQCIHIGADGISSFLYKYNTRPLTLELHKMFNPASYIEQIIDRELALTTGWEKHVGENEQLNYWLSWSKKMPFSKDKELKYKIYLGLAFEDILKNISAISAVLSKSSCYSFKIGRGLPNLLRPDHFVCYFTSYEEVAVTYKKLLPFSTTKRIRAHYVPFTSRFPSQNIISWGIDHPIAENKNSWRQWICKELAYLLMNIYEKQKEILIDPIILSERLSSELFLSGINTKQWTLVEDETL